MKKKATETVSFRMPLTLKRTIEEMGAANDRNISQEIIHQLKKVIGGTTSHKQ